MSFIIAACPNPDCGYEVTVNDVPQPLRLYVVLAALMVHAATVDTLMQMPDYRDAKPGWDERIGKLTNDMDFEAEQMEAFGSAYDDEEEDDSG